MARETHNLETRRFNSVTATNLMKKEEIDNIFSYHPPTLDQAERYHRIRQAAKHLAYVIYENTPSSADQTASIRKLRECVMTANAAVALEPVAAPVFPPNERLRDGDQPAGKL